MQEATSRAAADAFVAGVGLWKFRPFQVAGQVIPVCSLVRLSDPKAKDLDGLPMFGGVGVLSSSALRRIAGVKEIAPDDLDKVRLQGAGGGTLVGGFEPCIDETGRVISVTVLEATGLPGYDAKIQRLMREWRYQPALEEGKPVSVCTTVTFVYSQPTSRPRRR